VTRRLLVALALIVLAGCGVQLTGGDEDAATAAPQRGVVVAVSDGDTIKVRLALRTERVRLIGIDTPETHRPNTPVECGARAATREMTKLAFGRRVKLIADPTQDRRDRFGRLLAYAETAAGHDLGEQLLRSGWGVVYVYGHNPFRRVGTYRDAARSARREGRGLWQSCHGDAHRPALP
jgi:micrococcal nuclease